MTHNPDVPVSLDDGILRGRPRMNAIADAFAQYAGDASVRERKDEVELLASANFAEGVAAFQDKRPAVFGKP